MSKDFDVVIAGGGLAGLTLGLQLKKTRPETSICIIEKSDGNHQVAGHKVGESTVELGTYYLREVLEMRDYLSKDQLPKHGLRFFLTPSQKNKIENRFEIGPVKAPKVPSHQLDRGILENKLIELNIELGNQVMLDAKVTEVEFGEKQHQVNITSGDRITELKSKWVVDATGRGFLIKRKLKTQKEIHHDVNAVWFRVKGKINPDDWSNDQEWIQKVPNGQRRLSTSHLMDKGYWVWIIPLVSGYTSIGIVADPNFHDFKKINRFELALEWIKENEPQFYNHLLDYKNDLLDFKVLKGYAHDVDKVFSEDRWCLVGESGAFLDPFYSPGTDLIALANSWTTDLINKDLSGADIYTETIVYQKIYRAIIDNWIEVYRNKYQLFGSTHVMALKIIWDWSYYWAIHTSIFMNNGYTDMKVLKSIFIGRDSIGEKLAQINLNIQDLFIQWNGKDPDEIPAKYLDPFEIDFLKKFHYYLEDQLDSDGLIERIRKNLSTLEMVAAEMIRYVSASVGQQMFNGTVNPYTDNLSESSEPHEKFMDCNVGLNEDIRADLEKITIADKIVQ